MIQAGVMVFVRRCMVRSLCSGNIPELYLGAAWLPVGIIVNPSGALFKINY
jgi:hypothetical protein